MMMMMMMMMVASQLVLSAQTVLCVAVVDAATATHKTSAIKSTLSELTLKNFQTCLPSVYPAKADRNTNTTKEEPRNDAVTNKENVAAAKRNRRNKTNSRQQSNKGEQQSEELQKESNRSAGSSVSNRTTSVFKL